MSTVGVPHNITRLKDDNIAVNLALSLHAPNQEIRKKIGTYKEETNEARYTTRIF